MNKADTTRKWIGITLAILLVIAGPAIKFSPDQWANSTIGRILPYVSVAVAFAVIGWCLARSSGPEISMSDLEYDEEWRALFVTVKNITDVPAIPEVFLTDVTDAQGKKQPQFMRTLEAHWRNYDPKERPVLAVKGAQSDSCPLKLPDKPNEDGQVALFAYAIDHDVVPVSRPTTIKDREVLHVTIVATCKNEKGDRGNSVTKKFELIPLPGSTAYSIRLFKPGRRRTDRRSTKA